MRWIVFAPVDETSCYGDFYRQMFHELIKKDHKVISLVGEKPPRLNKIFEDTFFIEDKIFYSEEFLLNEIELFGNHALAQSDLFCDNRDRKFLPEYLRITDRLMAIPRSGTDRLRLYDLTQTFWRLLLDKYKITAVFFANTPHFGFDTIFAEMCLEREIKIFYPARTEFKNLYMVRAGWLDTKVLLNDVRYRESFELVPQWIEYSKKKTSESIEFNSRFDSSLFFRTWYLGRLGYSMLRIALSRLVKKHSNLGSISALFMNSPKYFAYFSLIMYRFFQSRYLWVLYKKLASNQLPEKFLYFPLNFQPERTTDPEAGIYADLLLTIRALVGQLPKDCYVVVKEHPRQFDGKDIDLRKIHARNAFYYTALATFPQVRIASLLIDSSELIDRAIGCVVTTGSVGYEAAVQGKNVGCFGFPWYITLPNVHTISTTHELKEFIKRLDFISSQGSAIEIDTVEIKQRLANFLFKMPSKSDTWKGFTRDMVEFTAASLASAIISGKVHSLK